jgi:hypothetical protein
MKDINDINWQTKFDNLPKAMKITTSGSYTYIATADIGTPESEPVWRVKRIEDIGSDIKITWADGNARYNNVATDLTLLSYS